MDYEIRDTESGVEAYNPVEVHQWRPPCSCGVGLNEVARGDEAADIVKVHNWRPPCSCGVGLEDSAEE